MEANPLPLILEFDQVDLSDLKVADVKSLLPATSFDSVKQKLKNGDIKIFVNQDIPLENFEESSSILERAVYVSLNTIPLILLLTIFASALIISPWSLLALLCFPIALLATPFTYNHRHLVYSILLAALVYSVIIESNLNLGLNITTLLFTLIWFHYRDQKKIDAIFRAALENEQTFLNSFLSNKVIIANNDRIFNSIDVAEEVLKKHLLEQPKELSLDDKLFFCKQCTNRAFDKYQGVVCGLTRKKPTFIADCPEYSLNKDYGLKEAQKYHRRENLNSKALFSTRLSFILIDIIIIGTTLSALSVIFKNEPLTFLNSGTVYLLLESFEEAPYFQYFMFPVLLLIFGFLAKLKLKQALLITTIIVSIDTVMLIFYKQFFYEPHIRIALVMAIGNGYLNIENAKTYSKNLAGSNAFLRSYFKDVNDQSEK
ncbi:hypothetical protein [Roseivirga echinicomitans]|uniref:Uncharacterized protein n=1 Tax=Roseivirga echinicomitans TaxID=296218 RepID=A0A150XXF2_9BACT|nr:hypothetical protein [Roseivirga echinicomitans]KYG83447.1 hypothetical protein AWN68_01185 [Roseivirga echinicomitans]